MAGRKAHVQSNEGFDQFIQSIPEDSRGRGYWRIRMEKTGINGGGVLQVICGFLEFEPGETYETLRDRVKKGFANLKGPGVFFAIPCDQEKKEIKNVDKARFEFKESEVEMPEMPGSEINPLGDTLKNVKKMSNDMAALQSLDLQQKILNKYLGVDKEKKEEEHVVEKAAQGNNISDLLMWKSFMDDGSKKKDDPVANQQISELKASLEALKAVVTQPKPDDRLERLIEKSNEDTRRLIEKMMELNKPKEDSATGRILEKLVEVTMQPKNDDKLERLIEKANDDTRRLMEKMIELQKPAESSETKILIQKLIEDRGSNKQENAFQSMMAMTMNQQEAHNKTRLDEERRRENERAEGEKQRIEAERRKEDERKEDRRRLEDDRKGEQKKAEEIIKLERDKFQDELKEQKRRFDEDMRLRRDEMKHEEEKARLYASEQQKFQLQLLDVFKNKNDSSLDMVSKVVDSMTTAGSNSMKMAQEAATTIMEVAKNVPKKDKEESGNSFADIIKHVAPMVAPMLGPYAEADAKLKMLQGAAKLQGQAKRNARQGQMEEARMAQMAREQMEAQAAAQAHAQAQAYAQGQATQQGQQQEEETAGVSGMETETAGEETGSTQKEGFSMIAEYLKAYPIVKDTLMDTLADGLNPTIFVNFVTGLNQPTLESLIAGLRPQKLMDQIKRSCTAEEQKIVDANLAWFEQLRKKMIKLANDDEAEDEAAEAAAAKAAAVPVAVAGNGAAAVPAPVQAPQPQK